MNTNSPQTTFGSRLPDDARQALQNVTATAKDAVGQASQAAREAAGKVADTAKDAYQDAKARAGDVIEDAKARAGDAYQNAREKAGEAYDVVRAKADETYRTVRAKADETAAATGEYVRQHPMPSLLGAVALGVGLGFLLAVTSRRPQPTFREHFVEEPLDATRDALYSILAPVARKIRAGYDSARGEAEHLFDEAHHFNGSRVAKNLGDQVRRVGSNLKFW